MAAKFREKVFPKYVAVPRPAGVEPRPVTPVPRRQERLERLSGVFAALAGFTGFVAAASGQNGEGDQETGGLVVAVVAGGLTVAGLVIAARAVRRRRAAGRSEPGPSTGPPLFVVVVVLGVLAVAIFGSLLIVVVNGTVGDGVLVDRATLLWQLAIASGAGAAIGLLVPPGRPTSPG